MESKEIRPIYIIVAEMVNDMKKICRSGKRPTDWKEKFAYAVPYVHALMNCSKPTDMYGMDSARNLIPYLLGNLSTYRGETAKRLKAELKAMLK